MKKIGKNAFFLYLRLVLTLGVSLYTSRMVLKILGFEDFGLYGVIGGVVTTLGFLNSSMATATQRFFSIEIASGNSKSLKQSFNTAFNIHFFIGIIIFFLAETLGMFFFEKKIEIPNGKEVVAKVVFHFSLLSFIITLIQVPFNALIIAREKMNIFAIIGLLDSVFKLLIVYFLNIWKVDKLQLYSYLYFGSNLFSTIFLIGYCYWKFTESRYKWFFNNKIYVELLSFSAWNLIGSFAYVVKNQGINILLNLFYGNIANAAFGIMTQVNSSINSLVVNFQTAFNPQIIKNYSLNKNQESIKLIFLSSRVSFFLSLILTLPIISNTNYFIELWLGKPPENTIIFVKLSLIGIIIESISGPLITGAQASGKIKYYQITLGLIQILSFPITYIVFLFWNVPYYFQIISIILATISVFIRVLFLKKLINLSVKNFITVVMYRVLAVSLFIFPLIYFSQGMYNPWLNSFLLISVTLVLIVFLGITKLERIQITKYLIFRIKNKLD